MLLNDCLLSLLLASFLLSFERIAYVLIWRQPQTFVHWASRIRIAEGPVRALERLFYAFKLIQLLVFGSWIFVFSESSMPFPTGTILSQSFSIGLILVGQILNLSTFWQLGRTGIFYGVRFGHEVPWCTGFPFSVCSHPQYLGTVMSIWGLFLLFLYPGREWFLIPLVQTVFYLLGAYFENSDAHQSNSINHTVLDVTEEVVESA